MALGPRVMALCPSTSLTEEAISTKKRGYAHTKCAMTTFYFTLQYWNHHHIKNCAYIAMEVDLGMLSKDADRCTVNEDTPKWPQLSVVVPGLLDFHTL